MPGDGVGALLQELGPGVIIGAAEDKMNFWEALGSARGLMDMVAAKVAGVVDCFFDGK